jgi:hypothetical protein
LISATTTVAPSRTKVCAAAKPIPRPALVMIAILFFSRFMLEWPPG